jgi:hypothetical protein
MVRFAVVLSIVMLAAPPALAVDYAGCYARDYDAAHLKAHALQEITRMRLSLEAADGDKYLGQIAAGFREAPDLMSSAVTCQWRGEKIACDIESNGGTFTVATAKSGILITNTSTMRFGNEETGISFRGEKEHLKFLLRPVACP